MSLIKQLAQEWMGNWDSILLSQFSWKDRKTIGAQELENIFKEDNAFVNSIYAIMTKTDNNSTHKDFTHSVGIFVLFLRSFTTRKYTSTTANTIKEYLNRNDQSIINNIANKLISLEELYKDNVKPITIKWSKNKVRYEWQDTEKHEEYTKTKESLRSIIKEFLDSEKDFDNLYGMYKDVANSRQ